MHHGHVCQHGAVQPHLCRLALVIQLLPQALAQFLVYLLMVDRVVHAVVDRHGQTKLPQVGLHGARHVGVLQLAGNIGAIRQRRAMHLPQAGGCRRFAPEPRKLAFPLGPQLACHATTHEVPAHRRRVGLQFRQFRRVLGRQRIRYGGQELRHLHQRTLKPAQDRPEIFCMRGPIGLQPEHTRTGHACGDTAHGPRSARHPAQLTDQRCVAFVARHYATASSSSINPAITSSPLAQNFASDASSPNGASSSLWRLLPPARSRSRYFVWNPGWPVWNTA